MSELFVYMTCSSKEEARDIGTVLVERRLAACVNIIDSMHSMYWWNGKVETAEEVVLIAKTRDGLLAELTEAVKVMHSYEVPCVVALPITGGNPEFLGWIREETAKYRGN
ncbi:divalent-cation tolerance protein CutA [uncultured Pseudodesulfovibrio sp.]|jgi:periplasmic divalent cation tolerance protein|uniref:divalent-cation tolerance protein CutA n=1 Tax=uncultured Pseudodesulfovibrio sp. TaxID=2035858 RepID=UPI0029C9968A|nr:divalent-cation tolerance protein CutA [uncultured Pseudodesulfovibrio sp.]